MCDCQGIVNTLTKFLEDGVKPEHIKEHDLWDQIFHLADGLTTKQLCIQWMPSHLEEAKNAQKRESFLKKGIITQEDIEGNVAADKMAFKGADAHDNITESIADMYDKLQFTVVVQKMLLSVWEDFIKDDGECNLADQQDLEEMERLVCGHLSCLFIYKPQKRTTNQIALNFKTSSNLKSMCRPYCSVYAH